MLFLRITKYLEELGKARKEAEQKVAADPTLKLENLLEIFRANVKIKETGKGRNKHRSMCRSAFSKELQDRSSYDPRFLKMTEEAAMKKMQQASDIRAWNEETLKQKRTKHLDKLARRMRRNFHASHTSYDEACPLCLEEIATGGNSPQTV